MSAPADPEPRIAADLAADAHEVASAAAHRADLSIVELQSPADLEKAAALLRRIWRTDSADELVNPSLMRALAYSGNYVIGGYRDEEMIGIAVAFFGMDHLHSHVTGVDPAVQGRGVGYALKLHQRAWALDRRIDTVSWTFDPLVRRNAYFNLQKLGALAAAYLPDFYGPLDDGINAGDASDRIYVRWRLNSRRSVSAARGQVAVFDLAALVRVGADILLGRDFNEAPLTGMATYDGRPVLVAVPAEIDRLRKREPALAARWRHAVRDALLATLDEGYRITGMARDGWYLLEAEGWS